MFFFDQQTFAPLYVLSYDRQGKHWRTEFFSYAHPAFYPGGKDIRVPILIGRSWVDFTADHATLALVTEANQHFQRTQPWQLAKDESNGPALAGSLYAGIEAVRLAAYFLYPYTPNVSAKICEQIDS